jgi:hypothetical protein
VKDKLSFRDWQKISAYLDEQLGARELAHFEKRLRSEPDLLGALDDLRQNQAILRRQPALRTRRNFTLTPEMVGARRRAPAYPTLGFVTALASLVLVILLAGDLFNQRSGPTAAPAQIANTLQREAAQPEDTAALSKAAPDTLTAMPAPALEAAPMAAAEAPTDAVSEILPGTPPPSAKMVAPPASAEEAAGAAPSEEAVQAFSLEVESTEVIQANPEVIEQTSKIFGVPRDLWRGVEISLALIALAAGIAWLILRRRS